MDDETMILSAAVLAGALVGWRLAGPTPRVGSHGAANITDRRARARYSKKAAPHVRTRDPENVDAVVLHQMGFSRGNDPSRYDAVTAHYKILPDGTIIQSHGWGTNLPAANGFNSRSLSVEFVGNLPKRMGSTNSNDYWNPEGMGMDQLTPAAAASGRALMRHFKSRGIGYVFAHRQAANKTIDPGPDVWFQVGQYAVEDLGMSDGGAGYHISGGSELPDYWRTRVMA